MTGKVTTRPMLFNGEMVRAILSGRKTQTRRIVKGAPVDWWPGQPQAYTKTKIDRHGDEHPGDIVYGAGQADGENWIVCPYGQPGDLLWVREAWARDSEDGVFMYRADVGSCADADAWEQGRIEGVPGHRWRPSIHIPRTASRITLEITGVRVERLTDISYEDALAEGVADFRALEGQGENAQGGETLEECGRRLRWPQREYKRLWGEINGPLSWDENPWVWVVEFRRVEC